MDKYELTNELKKVKCWNGEIVTAYRIRALKTFRTHVKKNGKPMIVHQGDLGGWVRSKENLSQEGNCWVGREGTVVGHAKVEGDAFVGEFAVLEGNAYVHGRAIVVGYTRMKDFTEVTDRAYIYGATQLHEYVVISGNTRLNGAKLASDIEVHNNFLK